METLASIIAPGEAHPPEEEFVDPLAGILSSSGT